ncbi:MAG: cytochrome b [Spirulina sp. DLM2.Bin59]|nr:MAG: cytochrome b [Spirulina sp. DLM2.Bin59]
MTTETQTPPKKPRLTSAFQHLMSIHWWMAWCYLFLFISGYGIVHAIPNQSALLAPGYDFHKSMGVLVMALVTWRVFVLLRVWWKKYTRRSPRLTPQWWRKVILHTLLYIFMWAVPITGFYLSNSFRSNNVKFFGLLLPDFFPQNQAALPVASQFHFWFAYSFLALIIRHTLQQWKVVKALWRRFSQTLQRHTAKILPPS